MDFRREASRGVVNLLSVEQHKIGRNSFNVAAAGVFEIRTKAVAFTDVGIKAVAKKLANYPCKTQK